MRNVHKKRHTLPSRRTILNLEALEDRMLLSGNVLATLDTHGLLSIVGDIGNNAIHLTQINPFGTPLLRVSGDLTLPGAPPSLGDVTTVNAVAFTDFDLSAITSISITMLDGNDSVVVGTGPATGFTLPHNITINAGAGADTFAFNNITANVIAVTAQGPGATNVSVNTVQAGEIDVTTGAGADKVTLNAVTSAAVNINTGGGGDTVNITASPPGPPPGNRPAIGVLTVGTGDATGATNTISMTATSAGIVSLTEGAAKTNNVTLTTSTITVAANITTGNATGTDFIDVENDTISGSAGLSITDGVGGAAVHNIKLINDAFAVNSTTGANLSVTVGDGVSYFKPDGTLIPANESTFLMKGDTKIGTASIGLGKFFTFVTLGDAANPVPTVNSLTLGVGDDPMTIALNTTAGKDESITVGSAADAGAPAFTITAAGTVGNNETVKAGNGFGTFSDTTTVTKAQSVTLGDGNGSITLSGTVGTTQTVTVGTGTGTITISGGTTAETFTFGDKHAINLSGTASALTVTLGSNATLTVTTDVTNAVIIEPANSATNDGDNITVGPAAAPPFMSVGSLSITAGKDATILVQNVTTTGGDIDVTVGDDAASVAVTASTSNNLSILAGNGLGGTQSTYFYLNGDTVNNNLILTALNGNNTIALQNLVVLDALYATAGDGINTVFAGDTTCLFGNIDGGPGASSIFWDLGGNFGFSVGALAPIINDSDLGLSANPINEGDNVTLTGTFFHPGNATGHTITINWGDASANTVQTLAGGVFSFSSSHRYLDEGVDNITVTVTDAAGNSGSAGTSITVKNVAPVIAAGGLQVSSATIKAGGSVSLTGTFSDPGILDTHTVVINWGDGSASTTLTLGANVLTFSASHQYLINLPGNVPYAVVATVTDDDAASSSASTTVTVQNVVPTINGFSPGVLGDHLTSATALTLLGNAAAGSTVNLYVNGNYTSSVGTTTADAVTGAWSINYTAPNNATTSFTVKSTDPAGNTTAASAPYLVTVAPTVFSPSGVINTDVPVFSWPFEAQAASYDVWLTDLTTGVGHVIGSSTTTSLAAPSALSPGHSYSWWVRGDSSDGTMGPWGPTINFSVAALAMPTPVGPSGTITTDTPTFTWSAVNLAVKYDVWLTDQTTGIGQVIGSSATTSLAAPAALSPGHSYSWWVRGDSRDGTMGAWSATTSFTIAALATPVPSSPTGTISTDMPTFTWSSVSGATKYDVWLTDQTTGIGHVIGSSTTTSLAAPAALSPGHSYSWWVRADSSDGTTGAWGATATFTITALAVPVPAGPSGTLNTNKPTFMWSGGGLATKYDVWLTDQTTGAGQVIGSSTATTLDTPAPLTPGHNYRWWVRGDSTDGTTGAWSASTDFAIAAPGTPVPSGPVGSSANPPTFTWSTVAGAAKYDVWVDDVTSGTSQILRNQSVAGTSWTSPALTPGHHYRWWVRAIGESGTAGSWSTATDFFLEPGALRRYDI